MVSQFIGGICGVGLSAFCLRGSLAKCLSKWMSGHVGHSIGPVFLKTAPYFIARESFRVDGRIWISGLFRWREFENLFHGRLASLNAACPLASFSYH